MNWPGSYEYDLAHERQQSFRRQAESDRLLRHASRCERRGARETIGRMLVRIGLQLAPAIRRELIERQAASLRPLPARPAR